MHDLIGQDIWGLGRKELAKKDIVMLRRNAKRRMNNKARMRKLFLKEMKRLEESRNADMMEIDIDTSNNLRPSQIKLRTMQNALSLVHTDVESQDMNDQNASVTTISYNRPFGEFLDLEAKEVFDVSELRPKQKEAVEKILTDPSSCGRLLIVERTGK